MEKVEVLGSSSKGNCYLLHLKNNKILILECGIPFKEIQQALNFDFSNVIGCLMTHEHKDHSQSIKQLLKYGITVYSHIETFKALNVENNPFIKPIENLKMFNVGYTKIFPFKVNHDCSFPLGFVIKENNETLLFATDTYKIDYLFKNINYMMIECNYDLKSFEYLTEQKEEYESKMKRVLFSHMELETTKKVVEKFENENLTDILLIHPSSENLCLEESLLTIQSITKANVEFAEKRLNYVFKKKRK